MPTRTRTPITDQERAERREAERELARHATEALLSSDGRQAWLRVRSHVALRRYSIINQLLIASQCPEATRVAGFRAWLRLGYCVRRGEKALRIYAPVPPSKAALERWRADGGDPGDRPWTRFRLTAVFDSAQVDELPPPAEPVSLQTPVAPVEGEELQGLLKPLGDYASSIGSTLSFEDVPGDANGFYELATRRIVVDAGLSPNGQVKVLLHELAHALMRTGAHDTGDDGLTYAEEELVVECVAHVVCSGLGLDASGHSIGYLASWSEHGDLKTLQGHAELIDALAARLEAVVFDDPETGPDAT